jgi:uncharacterized Zn finger protein (UPF0148 family)
MHGADCPSCGTHVELDFKPVSGLVWCPKCQKLFSPAGTGPAEEEVSEERNGEGSDKD